MGALAPNYYVQDGVVPRSKLPEMMKRIAAISKQFDLRIANVFHAGDGNLHPNILFDMRSPGELDRVIEAGAATLRACIELGGSITGEHGVGLGEKSLHRTPFQRSGFGSDGASAPRFRSGQQVQSGKALSHAGELRRNPPAARTNSGRVVDLRQSRVMSSRVLCLRTLDAKRGTLDKFKVKTGCKQTKPKNTRLDKGSRRWTSPSFTNAFIADFV